MLTHTYEMAPSSYFTVVVRARQEEKTPFSFPFARAHGGRETIAPFSHPFQMVFPFSLPPYFFRMHGAKLGNQSLLGSLAKPLLAAQLPTQCWVTAGGWAC